MPSEIRPSVWDDSEPDYAPFRKQIRGIWRWIPSAKYKKQGYAVAHVKLDGLSDLEAAARCRELTREMLTWYEGETKGRVPGTWGFISARFTTDDFSNYAAVAADTRVDYKAWMDRLDAAIGEVRVLDTDIRLLHEWQTNMRDNGRSSDYIKRWFTHFGFLVSHGIKIREPGCAEVKAIRSEMRIKSPAARQEFVTRHQVNAIVARADEMNLDMLSLATLLRFELVLRGTDVYGKWEPAESRGGGIQHKGKIWTSGMTWDMLNDDCSGFEKIINKTRDSLPEPQCFDLSALPEIQRRLLAIAPEERVGPVIRGTDGLPVKSDLITKQFKRVIRDLIQKQDNGDIADLGLHDDLRIADTRSGAGTEAAQHVDPMTLRDAMGHTQVTTTDRYVRGRSASINKVIELRQRKSGTNN